MLGFHFELFFVIVNSPKVQFTLVKSSKLSQLAEDVARNLERDGVGDAPMPSVGKFKKQDQL